MRQLPRLATTLLVSALLGIAGAGVAQPAQADPVIDLNFNNVTGETTLAKPKLTVAIPPATMKSKLDLGTGELKGDLAIPDLTVKMKADRKER